MKTDLLGGKPIKSIIMFAFPIMASAFMQYTYNVVDNIIVGRFVSTNALAAVGNVNSINSFIIGAALGLTSGFTIPVAQHFGSGDKTRMNKYAGNSITLSFVIGIIIIIISHIISNPILHLIHTPNNIISLSAAYVNILYFGVPFQMLYNNFTAIARAVGDSKKPLYFMFVSIFCNLVLDLLFVTKLDWGVKGAAAATVISEFIAMAFAGIYILKYNKSVSIKSKDLMFNAKIIGHQLQLGIPVSLQFTITSIGSMVLQSAVNGFGSDVVAAFTAAGKVESITNIPMSGLGVANATFVAQNYGARKYKRIVSTVKKIFVLDVIVSAICSCILFFSGESVVKLFMKEYNQTIINASTQYLFAISTCYSLVAVLFVLRNTLQGLGLTYANAIAGAGELIGRIAVAYVFTPLIGFNAVCFAGPMAWLLADIPLIIIYLRKRKMLLKA